MYLPDFLSKIGYQRTFCLHMAVKKHSDLKLVKLGSDTNFLFGLRSEAGVCARRRSNFLSRRRKKVTKERATLLSVTPTLRAGATCDARSRGAPWNSLRANALHSDNHGESDNKGVCPSAHAHPAPCASRHGQKGTRGDGPSLRSTLQGQALRAAKTRPSAAMARVVANPLLDAPVAECLRGGMRVGARMLRQLTRRICPNEAPQARSELCGAPRKCSAAGCPVAQRRGHGQQGRLLFGDFLSAGDPVATKRKLLRRRAHTPASALSTRKQSKNIAVSAIPISARGQKYHKSCRRLNP